jgi:hypothetical protein
MYGNSTSFSVLSVCLCLSVSVQSVSTNTNGISIDIIEHHALFARPPSPCCCCTKPNDTFVDCPRMFCCTYCHSCHRSTSAHRTVDSYFVNPMSLLVYLITLMLYNNVEDRENHTQIMHAVNQLVRNLNKALWWHRMIML